MLLFESRITSQIKCRSLLRKQGSAKSSSHLDTFSDTFSATKACGGRIVDIKMEGDFSIDKKSLEKIEHNREALLKYIERADKLILEAVEQRSIPDLGKYNYLKGQAERDLENLDESVQEASANESPRLVPTDYALDTLLVHTYDVDQFSKRIEELFLYYNTEKLERKLAPYFPLIQSSSMGKTKLLVEYKQSAANEIVTLFECTKQIPHTKLSDKFMDWFKVPEYCTEVH